MSFAGCRLELEASQARYFDLYDLAPVGYVTLTEQGVIQEANLRAATCLGCRDDRSKGARSADPSSTPSRYLLSAPTSAPQNRRAASVRALAWYVRTAVASGHVWSRRSPSR